MWIFLHLLFLGGQLLCVVAVFHLIVMAGTALLGISPRLWHVLPSVAFVLIVVLGLGVYKLSAPVVFEDRLGVPYTKDIEGVRCSTWDLGDSRLIYLYFRAPRQTVAEIIAAGRFEARDVKQHRIDAEAPDWWKPPNSRTRTYYYRQSPTPAMSSESEWLLHYEDTNEVYFRVTGVD